MRFHRISSVRFADVEFRMCSIRDDWGVDDVVLSAMELGTYGEAEAMSWWFAMLSAAKPGSTVFDVGAYTGLYSLLAASMRPEIKTVAIEASVVTYGRLIQNILMNNFDIRITPSHVAVSDRSGIARLGHAFGPLSMASGESLVPNYEIDHSELVAAVTLDDLVLQKPDQYFGSVSSRAMGILPVQHIAGMKIDVEGVEFEVLQGATELITRFRPPLIIEILDRQKLERCDAFLKSFGYEELDKCTGENYIYACGEDIATLTAAHADIKEDRKLEFSIRDTINISL